MGNIASSETRSGVSRRAALKAGVGVGVGVAAWTGPTITSFGATPAYAAGCTFVVNIELQGCRNTDQRSCADFGYHTLKDTGLPTGYSLLNNVPEGTCCTENFTPVLHFPDGIECAVSIKFNLPPQCSNASQGELLYGPSSDGEAGLPIVLACITPAFPSQTQYQIVAKCTTEGAPAECIT